MAKRRAERQSGPDRAAWVAALTPALALAPVSQARAQSLVALDTIGGMLGALVWWAITAGFALAALVAFGLLLKGRRDERLKSAESEVGNLRLALDRTRALLDADDQKTVVWDSTTSEAEVFGGLPERVGAPARKTPFLAFEDWLSPESAAAIETATGKLRRDGEPFQIAIRTPGGALLEASGRTSGRRALLRLRELTGERRSFAELKEQAGLIINEMAALRALADMLPMPLWRRNRVGRLTWVNASYVRAVEAESQDNVLNAGIELLPIRTREAIRETTRAGKPFSAEASAIVSGERRQLQVLDMPIDDGSIGVAIDVTELEETRLQLKRLTESNVQTLDQLAAGVALFGRDGRMIFHNAAFRNIWGLSEDFLATRPEESAILDQLRGDRKLPEQSNYRDWRARHLSAYQSETPREELWHPPDGRTLRVVALPNSDGGMTYIYENVTQEILLESRLTAVSQLQGETLDHLSEAVAVFSGDGRLRLFNPVFAEIWRLSPTTLKAEPHIGEIVTNCEAIYADRNVWDAIRAAVTGVDHGGQTAGRIQRPDGSVIDYATVALSEGMTMLTFVDVTDSARVERVLKERNEALIAADQLKSDFIQHVSYELRSPLQTIIGFSELLSGSAKKLNKQQREYLGHIDSSSRVAALADQRHPRPCHRRCRHHDARYPGDRYRRGRCRVGRGAARPPRRAADQASDRDPEGHRHLPRRSAACAPDPLQSRVERRPLLECRRLDPRRSGEAGEHRHLHRRRRWRRNSRRHAAQRLSSVRDACDARSPRRGRTRPLDREEPRQAAWRRCFDPLGGREGHDRDGPPAGCAGRGRGCRRIGNVRPAGGPEPSPSR